MGGKSVPQCRFARFGSPSPPHRHTIPSGSRCRPSPYGNPRGEARRGNSGTTPLLKKEVERQKNRKTNDFPIFTNKEHNN